MNGGTKIWLAGAVIALSAVVLPRTVAHGELTYFNTNESAYSIQSCTNPQVTEDRPTEKSLESEDVPPLGNADTGGADVTLDDAAQKARGSIQNPIVRPHVFPESPMPHQVIDFIAENLYFQTAPSELYTTWCVNGITQQGVVAGGQKVAETVAGSPVGPCCNAATRTPAADTDRDGLDDDWEKFYFIGKTINGVTYNAIDQVKPEDDPDHDGYCANSFPKQDAPQGIPVTIAPSSVGAEQTAADGTKTHPKYTTGDCYFPNGEEYVWGTDPTNPDTDGDGVPDEADVAGKGQASFSYTSDQSVLKSDEVRMTSVGMSQKGVVKIDSFARTVVIGVGDPLSVDVVANPSHPVPGDDVEVRALPHNLAQSAPASALVYTWSVNGVKMSDDRNGLGKSALRLSVAEISAALAAKKSVVVSVHTVQKLNSSLTKEGDGVLNLAVGDAVDLTYTPNCSAAGVSPTAECPVRTGTVTVTADLATLRGPDFDGLTTTKRDELLDRSEFRWYLDDVLKSIGHGKAHAAFAFQVTNLVGQPHHVRLALVDATAKPVLGAQLDIPVFGPEVVFTTSPALATSTARELTVTTGTPVAISASPRNFLPSSGAFSYAWDLDPQLTAVEQVAQTATTLSFTPRAVGSYTVTMTMTAGAEHASSQLRIRVQAPATQAQAAPSQTVAGTLRQRAQSFFASMLAALASLFTRHS